MNLVYKSIMITILALTSIAFAANSEPSGYEHGKIESSLGMEDHGYGSMEFAHKMAHQDYAQKDWMMTPHNGAIYFLRMKDLLGLNEKQISDLKSLRDSYRDENTIPEAKLEAAEESLKEIMEEDSISLEKADQKIKEIGSLESGLWLSYVKQLAKIKTIVTKDQLKKMWGAMHGQ